MVIWVEKGARLTYPTIHQSLGIVMFQKNFGIKIHGINGIATALLLIGMGCQKKETTNPPQQPNDSTNYKTRTAEELEAHEYIRAHTQPGTPYRLDLADPKQKIALLAAMKRGGQSKEKSPRLYQVIDAPPREKAQKPLSLFADQASGRPMDLNYIPLFDDTTGNRYHAASLSSILGGSHVTAVTLEIFEQTSGRVLKSQTFTQYAQGTNFTNMLDTTLPPNYHGNLEAIAYYTYIPNSWPADTTASVNVAYRTIDLVNPNDACMLQPNYCVRDGNGNCIAGQYQTSCTNKVANSTPIKVCYFRGSQAECDYWHQAPNHPTNFVFPIKGWVVFPSEVVGPPSGQITISLQNPAYGGGGGCYVYASQFAPLGSSWTNSGDTAKWAYDSAAFPDSGHCINYYDGTMTLMRFSGNVALQGDSTQAPPMGSFLFTSDSTMIGQPGVSKIPLMYLMQGCFAQGTKILLANGRTQKVEDFKGDRKEWVLGKYQNKLKVIGTTSGLEPDKVYAITLENKSQLTVTKTHPLLTSTGIVMAQHITINSLILTSKGTSKVTAIIKKAYAGKVYNILIENSASSQSDSNAICANGIYTGDAGMQRNLELEEGALLKSDREHVLKRLDPIWHEDFKQNFP